MKKQKKSGISQCMIVKNEEKNIERALSWGKGIVTEQIVVDTGSTDRTVEIARRMGAKVHHFQWIDDFAAAKNYAIGKAECEWIAFLDADEYFTPEDAKKLLGHVKRLQNTPYDGILTGLVNLDDEGKVMSADSQFRVFRNRPHIRYKRRIHEHLVSLDGSMVHVADAVGELPIFHTGYGDLINKEKNKNDRNLNLIQAELEQSPEDGEMWAYLGEEYDSRGEYKEAVEALRKSVSLMREQLGEYDMRSARTFYQLLRILAFHMEADEKDILAVYEKATQLVPKEADYDYVVGRYYAMRGNYQMAAKHLKRALELLEHYGNSGKSAALSGSLLGTYDLLAACCYNNGELAECVRYATMLLKENHYLLNTLVVLLYAFCKDPQTMEKGEAGAVAVASFLGRSFYDFNTLKDRFFVLRAAVRVEYQDLVTVMKGLFTPEELEVVEQDLAQCGKERKMKLILCCPGGEGIHAFSNQLAEVLKSRGHEVFTYSTGKEAEQTTGWTENPESLPVQDADAVISFEGEACREEAQIALWNRHRIVVAEILTDTPLHFASVLEKHPANYLLFCSKQEQADYVKENYGKTISNVSVLPCTDGVTAAYADRFLKAIAGARSKVEDMIAL